MIKAKHYPQLLLFMAAFNILLGSGSIITTLISVGFSLNEYPLFIAILYKVNKIAFYTLCVLFGLGVILEKKSAWKLGMIFYLTLIFTNIGEIFISLILAFVFKGGLASIFNFLLFRNIIIISFSLFVLKMLINKTVLQKINLLKDDLIKHMSSLYPIIGLITLIFLSRFYFIIVQINKSAANNF